MGTRILRRTDGAVFGWTAILAKRSDMCEEMLPNNSVAEAPHRPAGTPKAEAAPVMAQASAPVVAPAVAAPVTSEPFQALTALSLQNMTKKQLANWAKAVGGLKLDLARRHEELRQQVYALAKSKNLMTEEAVVVPTATAVPPVGSVTAP